MQIPVVIESLPGNRFRATNAAPVPMMADGDSAEESLRLWHEKYVAMLPADAEVVRVESANGNVSPWAKFIGDLKDDPLVDVWRECVEEYRHQRDVEAGSNDEVRV